MSIFRRAGANVARIIASALDPAAEAARAVVYSKAVAGITQLFSRASDGTITQLTPAPGFATPGIAAIVRTGAAVSKNLSTEGTLDWFALVNTEVQLRGSANKNWKIQGLSCFETFDSFIRGFTSGIATFPSTQTTNLSDSVAGTTVNPVLNAVTTGMTINTAGAGSGYGYAFAVPSAKDGTSRVMRMNLLNRSCITRITCTMDDGFSTTMDLDTTNNTQVSHEIKVTYSGARSMQVSIVQLSQYATGPFRIDFQNMTLSTV